MAGLLSGEEIVEIAMQIELNGKHFYEETQKKASSKLVKDALSWLAEQEQEHYEAFKALLDQVKQYEVVESYSGEYAAYLKAFASTHVFVKREDVEKAIEQVDSDEEIIKIAINFEKDSIIFFTEMREFVHEQEQHIVDKLRDQEREHLRRLLKMLAQARSPEY